MQSQAEIDQITNAMTNGSLNLFSPADDLMTLERHRPLDILRATLNSESARCQKRLRRQ